jgi:hypothetical protein
MLVGTIVISSMFVTTVILSIIISVAVFMNSSSEHRMKYSLLSGIITFLIGFIMILIYAFYPRPKPMVQCGSDNKASEC